MPEAAQKCDSRHEAGLLNPHRRRLHPSPKERIAAANDVELANDAAAVSDGTNREAVEGFFEQAGLEIEGFYQPPCDGTGIIVLNLAEEVARP